MVSAKFNQVFQDVVNKVDKTRPSNDEKLKVRYPHLSHIRVAAQKGVIQSVLTYTWNETVVRLGQDRKEGEDGDELSKGQARSFQPRGT
jgi:hypothetical protein